MSINGHSNKTVLHITLFEPRGACYSSQFGCTMLDALTAFSAASKVVDRGHAYSNWMSNVTLVLSTPRADEGEVMVPPRGDDDRAEHGDLGWQQPSLHGGASDGVVSEVCGAGGSRCVPVPLRLDEEENVPQVAPVILQHVLAHASVQTTGAPMAALAVQTQIPQIAHAAEQYGGRPWWCAAVQRTRRVYDHVALQTDRVVVLSASVHGLWADQVASDLDGAALVGRPFRLFSAELRQDPLPALVGSDPGVYSAGRVRHKSLGGRAGGSNSGSMSLDYVFPAFCVAVRTRCSLVLLSAVAAADFLVGVPAIGLTLSSWSCCCGHDYHSRVCWCKGFSAFHDHEL
eukprot:TRINITY_DN19684_c0_g1_i1.p1 TRINITY_DN19684_c0_g1~~TRINITY_DN19684_c0_g1_i1.p1  ORF type:complete len:344 (+),score=36.71 TRINITY_DN19684_c0_g1_i1:133-1164(+)